MAALLVICTGCEPPQAEHSIEPYIPTENSVYRVMLYFLNSNGIEFSPEARDIHVPRNSTPEFEAIFHLTKGPNSTLLSICPKGTKLEHVFIIENIAFIEVTYNNYTDSVSFSNFKTACEKTLSGLSGVEYTILTVNGAIPKEFEQETDQFERTLILYYSDDTSRYAIAVPYILENTPDEDIVERIILLLNLNPGIQGLKAVMPDYISLTGYSTEYSGQIGGTINISLNGSLKLKDEDAIVMPCIALSLLHSIPGIRTVNIEFSGVQENYSYSYTLSSLEHKRGNLLQLFFSDRDGVALVSVRRAVNIHNATFIDVYLSELFLGPGNEAGASQLIPARARSQLLKVYREGDIVILDFDRSFYDSFRNFNEMQERLLVYSIVNTMTVKEEINSVLFLCEHENIETIAGYINLLRPLYRNPGLLKK